eukprot:355003-Prorocentrum_lima.AAC.1
MSDNAPNQTSIDILTRAMRELMPANDLSRMRLAHAVQAISARVPSSMDGLAHWLVYYATKLELGM